MKTNTLMTLGSKGILVAGAAVALFASLVMLANADTAPSVAATAYNSSNAAVTSAPIGSNVYLTAMVASSSTTTPATGSVTFNRYAGTSCSGAATMQNVSLAGGAATSSSFAMTSGGISYIAAYLGDNNNVAASSSCQSVSAVGSSTSITGTLSTTTAVLAGTNVSESATLSGATANAGGSVNYRVFSNNSCTTLWGNAGSKTVTNALVASSDPFNFNIPGTYYWQATYSGDAANAAATSSCVSLSVIATSSVPTTTPGLGSISGTVYKDANRNDKFDSGDTGLSGFVVNLYANAGWWGNKGNKDAVASTTSASNGSYSFSNLKDGTYSVELLEQKKAGWNQSTDDYKKLVIKNGQALTGIDFGNTQISTSTNHGQGDGDNDSDDHGNKGGNGNHWGWFNNFWKNVGSSTWWGGKK